MTPETPNNGSDEGRADLDGCSICADLLTSLDRFFVMIERSKDSGSSGWLTVDEVAGELKISKSVVYRLIRTGELEAVDLALTDGRASLKGHYRIRRSSLEDYLRSKRVRAEPRSSRQRLSRHYPKVENHLGI